MIKISKQNNSLTVEGVDNVFYPNNGQNSYPLNSLIVVTDNSDMATFRSVATNDVLFSGLIKDITINGEAVTKDTIIAKFDAVSNSSTGGGGGTVDAYTKEEADNKFASKDELTNVQTVANDADTKVDALTPRVEGVETAMDDKQDLLVSGTNIKTINNQSILGEGNIEISDYYTKTEADTKFASKDELTAVETVANNADTKADTATSRVESVETALNNKQDTLVSGTNIKTINSQSIIGSGDLAISGVSEEQAQEIAKIPTIEAELAQKADTSAVPTVQTGADGTNKNYVYSDGTIGNPSVANYGVISNMYRSDFNNKLILNLKVWGKQATSKQVTLPAATTTGAGVMSAADKTKLDSIPENIPTQTEVDNIAANVSALQTAMDGKQPTLVSGTNIKTINGNSILGEGNLVIEGGGIDLSNYYTKTETDTKLDTKQNTLVSGTNIKTINSESILGTGDIQINVPTVQTGNNGTNKNYVYSNADSSNKNDKVVSYCYFRKYDSDRLELGLHFWGANGVNTYISIPLATPDTAGTMSGADKTKLDSISTEWTGTQSEFDALETKDNNTIYYVTE